MLSNLVLRAILSTHAPTILGKRDGKAHELGVDIVSLMHISSVQNSDFQKMISPQLDMIGGSPISVLGKLIREKSKFVGISTENLFDSSIVSEHQRLSGWKECISLRYKWVV